MNLVSLVAAWVLSGVLATMPAPQSCPPNADEWDWAVCDDGNPIDGYWWWGETWVPGLIRNRSQFVLLPPVIQGRAVWYAPGVMEATAQARELSLEGYLDGVAAMSCADIGLDYWILKDGVWEGPYLVVDCPQLDDVWGVIVGRQEAVEVGWSTAERWGGPISGGWQVVVSRIGPDDGKHFIPAHLWEWYPEIAKFYPRDLVVTLDRKPIYYSPSSWRIDGSDAITTFHQPTLADFDWPSESRFVRQTCK